MHVQQPPGPGALVEIVDILGDDQQLARPFRVEPRQRLVRRIGLDPGEIGAAGVVEGVDQSGIARERLGRGDVLDPMALPQSVRPAEGGEARFRPRCRRRSG